MFRPILLQYCWITTSSSDEIKVFQSNCNGRYLFITRIVIKIKINALEAELHCISTSRLLPSSINIYLQQMQHFGGNCLQSIFSNETFLPLAYNFIGAKSVSEPKDCKLFANVYNHQPLMKCKLNLQRRNEVGGDKRLNQYRLPLSAPSSFGT